MKSKISGILLRPGAMAVSALVVWCAGLPTVPRALADEASARPAERVAPRRDGLPRKVLLGTVVSGYDAIFKFPLEKRLQRMDELVGAMETQARAKYPGRRLDLAVLTEWFMSRPGATLEQQAVRLGDVSQRIEACARQHECYLVVPLVLREEGEPLRYSNVAVLVDREGRLIGAYRKVHPTTDHLSYALLEGGITPGRDYPVFDCDFGRVGIQICYDVMYPEGWQMLAKEGAEIVAFPSETSVTARPSMYALQHRYYIVSATPKDHAAIYNPLGMIDAEATQEGVLVHQIDLSYAITGWAPGLDGGGSLRRKYGDGVGFTYYQGEDAGIFWSNDPRISIGQMFKAFGYHEPDDDAERSRLVQDRARGGPPMFP
ncbi:MAG TPA: carbon-nitrogen hydrolase family protein [Opitutaceae bacterium]|nr:carbon-nitrogen hydrolase family protein [Opitutaceae bacterium]